MPETSSSGTMGSGPMCAAPERERQPHRQPHCHPPHPSPIPQPPDRGAAGAHGHG
jgi:hypothetical protein